MLEPTESIEVATPIGRAALLGRRVLLLGALVALIASLTASWLRPGEARAEPAPVVERPPATAPPGARKAAGPTGVLNLNTATGSELEMLPGIGPAKAERILAFRAKHGPFKRVFDLRRVKGFGKKTVDRLTPFLTVSERTTLRP